MMIDERTPLIEFNANDRCDGCGSQAYSVAIHEEHSELLFCIHHRKASYDNLLDEGWEVIDDYEAMSRILSPDALSAMSR